MNATYENRPARILVVDDDIDLLMLLERQLEKAGYYVYTAASIPEGEELIPLFHPDLIILDINVAGMDGRVMAFKLKTANPQMRIIMVSGFDLSTSRAMLFGADELLTKPFENDWLLLRIKALLNETAQKPENPFFRSPGER